MIEVLRIILRLTNLYKINGMEVIDALAMT